MKVIKARSRSPRPCPNPTALHIKIAASAPPLCRRRAQNYAMRMKQDNVHRAIMVVQASLTAFARQSLLETQRSAWHIEQFSEQELLVNITEHVLVPTHQARCARLARLLVDIDAPDPCRAAGLDDHAGQNINHGRFAGAIRPQKAENRAGRNAQIDALQRGHAAFPGIDLGQTLDLDGECRRGGRLSRER